MSDKNKEFKAVVFDLDGVICFTDEYHYRAWKALADKLDTPFDRSINNRLRGVSRMASLEIVLERYSGPALSEEEKLALATEKNEIYRASLSEMSTADLSDEVKNTLDELRARGYLLAIGSSSKNTPFILHQIGLEGYFDAVSDGNNIARSKPDPEVFLKAAAFLGVQPQDCLVVEDAVSGAEAAHRGGMKAACVGDAAANQAGDYNLASVGGLLDIL
jgi:beta-phosphoglucomutase